MTETSKVEAGDTQKANPMTAGKLLAYYVMLAVTAGVLGFCAALAYATFVKTCRMMGVG